MPPLRRLLFAAVSIVALAAAASWIAQRGPRKFGPEPVEVASVERATPTAQAPQVQPRRGAGTTGARAGSLGAVAAPGEYEASQNGGAEIPRFGRAPRPSPVPQHGSISTDAQPEGGDAPAELAWSGRGVEEIPPPTPGRDPRDGESAGESDAPPDPTTIAAAGSPAPDAPAPRTEQPAPRAESPSEPSRGGADSGADPVGAHESPDSGEPVTADSPLTADQIDDLADKQVAGLDPAEAEAVKPIVVEQITTNSNQAFDWTNSAP